MFWEQTAIMTLIGLGVVLIFRIIIDSIYSMMKKDMQTHQGKCDIEVQHASIFRIFNRLETVLILIAILSILIIIRR